MTRPALIAVCLLALFGNWRAPVHSAEPDKQLSTLEGSLRVHPKYLYKFYIDGFADGQKCALFGDEQLFRNIALGSTIEVKGRLATRFHPGTTKSNLSSFGRTWFIYMDVESVKVLRIPNATQAATPLPPTSEVHRRN